MKSAPAKSTACDGLRNRDNRFFEDLYFSLVKKYQSFLSDSRTFGLTFKEVLLIDSTTIRLFSDLLKGVGRNPKGDGKKKGGLKVHMLIDAVQSVGRFIKIGLKGSLCSFFPILDKDEFVLVERKTGKIREIKINRQLKHS